MMKWLSALGARRSATSAAALLLVTLAGCEFGRAVVPEGRDQLVVHGVLNPGISDQLILVERALTGRVAVNGASVPYDSLDPVVSNGGIPVSGARVVVYGPSGDSAVAQELRTVRTDGRGAGAYRIRHIPAGIEKPAGGALITLQPGGTYDLRVSAGDQTVTGRTTIPASQPRNEIVVQPFDRDRDSVFIGWSEVPLAARYAVHIASPRGSFQLFVEDFEYLVSGTLANTSQVGLPRVFIPGFLQTVLVAAVDSNYHDYYRSGSDRFTGRGLLTRLQGGTGLFGSYVLLRTVRFDVSASRPGIIDGTYRLESPAGAGIPSSIRIMSEHNPEGPVTRVSGWYTASVATTERLGMLGDFVSDRATLALLRGQSARDTAAVLEGQFISPLLTLNRRGINERIVYRRLEP